MNIKIISKTKKIKEILGGDEQLTIPRFQRAIVWQKRNTKEFLNDIFFQLKFNNAKITTSDYFLGTMVFYNSSSTKEREIIDGQQRLTTITIIFSIIKNFQKKFSDKDYKETYKYISRNKELILRRSPGQSPFFTGWIQEKTPETTYSAETEEDELVKKTILFLEKELSEKKLMKTMEKIHKKTISTYPYKDILIAIRNQILKCSVIDVASENKEGANKIFEILNSRGKNLTFLDLIKNKIFECIESKQTDFPNEKWKSINKILSEAENASFEEFYADFWASKYGQKNYKKLYDDFIAKTKPSYETCKDLLLCLEKEAKNYKKIIAPYYCPTQSEKKRPLIKQSLNYFREANVKQPRYVILILFRLLDLKKINRKKLQKTIIFLEKAHFAAILTTKNPNIFSGIYSGFSEEINKKNDYTENEVWKILKEKIFLPIKKHFIEREIKEAVLGLEYSSKTKNKSNEKTKHVIYQIHCHENNEEIYPNESSIEHIWNEDPSIKPTISIGNLIVLESKINNRIVEKNFSDKKEHYKTSKYFDVKELSKKKTWDNNSIEKRAEKLADLFWKIITKATNL